MKINIIKFGGDALSTITNQLKVANIIKSLNDKTIVIVSAMGRAGFPYSTDNLKALIEDKYITPKEKARLISLGEIISSVRLSYILNKEGINAYALSLNELNFICDGDYLNGDIENQDVFKLNELLNKYSCLICPGFSGLNKELETITFGRNSSDYTCACIAKYLGINEITLFKNVDGVYHTPPVVYKKSYPYRYLSYDQMLALCEINFNIVMKKAIIVCKENNITIKVKSYDDLNLEGTIISSKESNDLILGYNILDREVKIATFYPCKVKELLNKSFSKHHIFVTDEIIINNTYSFTISKSVSNLIKKLINDSILENKV